MSIGAAPIGAVLFGGAGIGVTAPTLAPPIDRQQTSITVQTSAYAGPGTHAGTTLQVRLDGASDWDTLVYSETRTTGDLRTFQVTGLTSGEDYEFRALHTSSNGTDSDWSTTLDGRTLGALTEPQQADLLFLMKTPISGASEGSNPARWPDTGPSADIGLAINGTPTYREDENCTGLDVVEFDGTGDFYEDTLAGSSNIPNAIDTTLGADGDFTFICVVRNDAASANGTIFGCHTFGGDNVIVIQVLKSPDRFRVLGNGIDLFSNYTPVGGGDLDVFCVTYDESTLQVTAYHFNTQIGQGTASSAFPFSDTNWTNVGQDRDPAGVSEEFEGVMSFLALWSQIMGDDARQDNVDYAADNFTCGGASGGGGSGCSLPIVTYANNAIYAGGPRVDVLLLGTPPANHTQSRYRIKRASDDAIVFPTSGDWYEPGVGLLLTSATLSLPDSALGIDLYAEADWYNGDTSAWCNDGTEAQSTTFQINTRQEGGTERVDIYETASPV